MVNAIFTKGDAQLICEIPISPYSKPDILIWRCTNIGEFSVKSAYHLLTKLDNQKLGQSSNSSSPQDSSIKIWNLKNPNAAKNFLQKAYLNALPTQANLLKREVLKDLACPICKLQLETVEHILLECPSTRDVQGHVAKDYRKLVHTSSCLEAWLLFSWRPWSMKT